VRNRAGGDASFADPALLRRAVFWYRNGECGGECVGEVATSRLVDAMLCACQRWCNSKRALRCSVDRAPSLSSSLRGLYSGAPTHEHPPGGNWNPGTSAPRTRA
jgi:hypothetical protein